MVFGGGREERQSVLNSAAFCRPSALAGKRRGKRGKIADEVVAKRGGERLLLGGGGGGGSVFFFRCRRQLPAMAVEGRHRRNDEVIGGRCGSADLLWIKSGGFFVFKMADFFVFGIKFCSFFNKLIVFFFFQVIPPLHLWCLRFPSGALVKKQQQFSSPSLPVPLLPPSQTSPPPPGTSINPSDGALRSSAVAVSRQLQPLCVSLGVSLSPFPKFKKSASLPPLSSTSALPSPPPRCRTTGRRRGFDPPEHLLSSHGEQLPPRFPPDGRLPSSPSPCSCCPQPPHVSDCSVGVGSAFVCLLSLLQLVAGGAEELPPCFSGPITPRQTRFRYYHSKMGILPPEAPGSERRSDDLFRNYLEGLQWVGAMGFRRRHGGGVNR